MSNKKILIFLLVSCALPMRTVVAQESLAHVPERQAGNELLSGVFAYLSPEAQSAFVTLEKALPDHGWSLVFKSLCKDIQHEGNLAPYEPMVCIVNECLAVLAQHEGDAQMDGVASEIQKYKELLLSGDVSISAQDAVSVINGDEQAITRACCNFCQTKPKKFLYLCSTALTVGFLNVTGALVVGGVNFNSLASLASSIGATGAAGIGGLLGAAEFIQTTGNVGVLVGAPFSIATQVYNNSSGAITSQAAAGGTVFTLNTTGTYVVDYEMSLSASGSVAIFKGSSVGGLAIDTNTIAGSATALTWIHGRAFITVGTTPVFFAIAPAFATDTVAQTGDLSGPPPVDMIRLTILKIATT